LKSLPIKGKRKKKNYLNHEMKGEGKKKTRLTFSGKFLAMALCGMGSMQSK
jgi:hypothetical protein